MSLYKRGKVYWSAVWVDGVRHLRSLETGNRRRAEMLEQAVKDELHAKHFQLPDLRPEMTFGELYARFLAEGEVKAHHLDRARHFLPFFADAPIGQITKNDMVRYRKHRHEEHLRSRREDHPKPLSDATVNRDISVIRHLLYWGSDEGFIATNPIARIRLIRERRQRRPVLSVLEEERLLAECSDHLRPIVVTAVDTGMRRGELLNQLWEDIDFDAVVLSVSHSKTPEGEHRQIPLTRRVYEMLSASRQSSGYLFSYDGAPLRGIKTGWAGALRRSGIRPVRVHDLRHTFNSRLVEAGVIADVRKELMGHSRGGDVHSIYTHVELPLLRDAIARLEAWRSAKLSTLTTNEEGSLSPQANNATPTKETP